MIKFVKDFQNKFLSRNTFGKANNLQSNLHEYEHINSCSQNLKQPLILTNHIK